jgi:hypothetical protein
LPQREQGLFAPLSVIACISVRASSLVIMSPGSGALVVLVGQLIEPNRHSHRRSKPCGRVSPIRAEDADLFSSITGAAHAQSKGVYLAR